MSVYASSDWHGCLDPAQKVLDFLKPDDTLYFLGDAADRGPDGVKIISLLMDDPRVIMIKGNHDELMQLGIEQVIYDEAEIKGEPIPFNDPKVDISWWQGANGGSSTFEDLWKLTKVEKLNIRYFLRHLPLQLEYHSYKGHTVIMEHAGYSPFYVPHQSHDPLWDRRHFHEKWNAGWNTQKGDPNTTYLIHGHTPVQFLKYDFGYVDQKRLTKEELLDKKAFLKGEERIKPTILRYCEGHKFDLDLCTFTSGRIALLNLDTFEEIYFDKGE